MVFNVVQFGVLTGDRVAFGVIRGTGIFWRFHIGSILHPSMLRSGCAISYVTVTVATN